MCLLDKLPLTPCVVSLCVLQVAVEVAAAPGVSVRAADRCPGPAGAGGASLASEQQECPAGQGWPSYSGLLPPLL